MKPTANIIFAEKTQNTPAQAGKKEFTVVKSNDVSFTVIAVGKDVKVCKVGNTIIFTNSSVFTIDNKDIYTLEEQDVRGVS